MDKKQMNELQYSLPFDYDNDINIDLSERDNHAIPSFTRTDKPKDQISEYEAFSTIKIKDLYASDLADDILLNVLVKNNKVFLVEFLRMSDNQILSLKGVGKLRIPLLLEWKQQILSDPYPYLLYHKKIQCVRILPEYEGNGDRNFLELLLLFAQQYKTYLEDTKENDTAQMFSLYLGLDETPKSYKEIADLYSLTSERIRQKLARVSKHWRLLLHNETIKNLQVTDSLLNSFDKLSRYIYRPVPVYLIPIYFTGASEKEVMLKFLRLLDLWKFDLLENTLPLKSVYLLIHKDEKIIYKEHLSLLISIMRPSPYWLHQDAIRERIDEQTKQIDVQDNLIQAILSYHPCIERTNDGFYRLKWEYLNAVVTEIRRIILDAKKPLFREEILIAYNTRAQLCGKKTITDKQLIISSDEHFFCQSKSRLWLYEPNGNRNIDVRLFMSDYLISIGGKITFQEMLQVVRKANYQYSDQTIRAYLTVFCRRAVQDSDLFIHEQCLSTYPEIRVRKQNLFKKKRSSPEYYDQIIQRTISCLQDIPSHKGLMAEMFNECKSLLPEGIKANIIYKIWKNTDQLCLLKDEQNGKNKWIALGPNS